MGLTFILYLGLVGDPLSLGRIKKLILKLGIEFSDEFSLIFMNSLLESKTIKCTTKRTPKNRNRSNEFVIIG
ncbi:hypothetical protein BH10BAC5_BH10BAC5_00030 [soil metagenome]